MGQLLAPWGRLSGKVRQQPKRTVFPTPTKPVKTVTGVFPPLLRVFGVLPGKSMAGVLLYVVCDESVGGKKFLPQHKPLDWERSHKVRGSQNQNTVYLSAMAWCSLPPKQRLFLPFIASRTPCSAPRSVPFPTVLLPVRSFRTVSTSAPSPVSFFSVGTRPSFLGSHSRSTVFTMGPKRTISQMFSRVTATTKGKDTTVTVEEASATTSMELDTPRSKRQKAKRNYNEDQDDDDDEDKSDKDEGDRGSKEKASSSEKAATEPSTVATTPAKPALTKKGSVSKAPLRASTFTNTTMPDNLELPKAPEGCIKITSWNVSGLNASLKKVGQESIAVSFSRPGDTR